MSVAGASMASEAVPWRVRICTDGFERGTWLEAPVSAAGFEVDLVPTVGDLGLVDDPAAGIIAVLADTVPGWLRLVGRLSRSRPHVRVLLVTDLDDRVALVTAIHAGVDGVARPDDAPSALVGSLIGLRDHGVSLPRALTKDLVGEVRGSGSHVVPGADGPVKLTHREWQILQFMAQGRTTREIAAELYVAVGTVRSHVSSLLAKLGVGSREEAAALLAQE